MQSDGSAIDSDRRRLYSGHRQFRSTDTGLDVRMKLFFLPVFQRFDTLLDGLGVTVLIALLAIVISMIAGLGLALARRSSIRPVRWLAVAYIDVFRNTPFVVQLFFFYFGLPEIGVFIDAFTTGVIALSLAAATSTAEVIRAGMESVDRGVIEAARAYGLSPFQQYRYVILPIAFRFAVRPLGSVFVNLVLTTSVLSTITVNDLMSNAENVASETFRPFETYVVVLVLFWLATFAVSAIVNLASALWLRRSSDRVAVR
jgi:His/Glu/Gln/Arg/opine family amino acid ABC transporter permease subunit